MNERFVKRLLVILTFGTILFACSSSDSNTNQNQESTGTENTEKKNLSDKDPEVLLAIIQEGTNPPSERLVERFGEVLNSLAGYYSDITTKDMADKLVVAYDIAAEKGNEGPLLQFVEDFRDGVKNSIESSMRYEFSEYLANYICYKIDCDTKNEEVVKYFDKKYATPLTKSYYKDDKFILIDKVETFRQRFNSLSREATSSLRVEQVKFHDGTPDDPGRAFEYSFSSKLYIIGGLNKVDNSINNLTLVFENNDSARDAANFLVAIVAIIASTNPNIPPEDRGNIMEEVGLTDSENISATEIRNGKTIRNGIEYNFSIVPDKGLFLFNAGSPSN